MGLHSLAVGMGVEPLTSRLPHHVQNLGYIMVSGSITNTKLPMVGLCMLHVFLVVFHTPTADSTVILNCGSPVDCGSYFKADTCSDCPPGWCNGDCEVHNGNCTSQCCLKGPYFPECLSLGGRGK